MRLRSTLAALIAAATLAAPLAAQNVTFSGTGYYSLWGDFTFSFVLPESPTPDPGFLGGTGFQLLDQQGTFFIGGATGTSVPAAADLGFYTSEYCGGFTMDMGGSEFAGACGDEYAQLFTGSVDAPTFVPGFYGNLYNPDSSSPVYLSDATIAAVTTTPEPGSVALLATGLMGLVPMARRRKK